LRRRRSSTLSRQADKIGCPLWRIGAGPSPAIGFAVEPGCVRAAGPPRRFLPGSQLQTAFVRAALQVIGETPRTWAKRFCRGGAPHPLQGSFRRRGIRGVANARRGPGAGRRRRTDHGPSVFRNWKPCNSFFSRRSGFTERTGQANGARSGSRRTGFFPAAGIEQGICGALSTRPDRACTAGRFDTSLNQRCTFGKLRQGPTPWFWCERVHGKIAMSAIEYAPRKVSGPRPGAGPSRRTAGWPRACSDRPHTRCAPGAYWRK